MKDYDLQWATRMLQNSEAGEEERGVVVRFLAAQSLYEGTEKALSDFYMPLLKRFITAGELGMARRLVLRAPDCVTRVFMMDQLREAEKKAEKKP